MIFRKYILHVYFDGGISIRNEKLWYKKKRFGVAFSATNSPLTLCSTLLNRINPPLYIFDKRRKR